jgi:hypothetical protein
MEESRRKHSRVKVTWPVTIQTADGSIDGEVENVSLGGALIKCRQLPSQDETFELSIDIPEYIFPVSVSVEKVRTSTHDIGGTYRTRTHDLAVRFLDIPEEDLMTFHNAVEGEVRSRALRSIAEHAVAKTSTAIETSLIRSVEELARHLGRSFKDLFEEALKDLVEKYGEEIPDEKDST